MAKKSLKDAAAAGTSVFDTIAAGSVQYVESAENVKDVIDAQDSNNTITMERLNLSIPSDIKAYLRAAAYRESSPTKTVFLTEYLCKLVRADMELHKDK